MNHPFIIYLLIGFIAYVALGLITHSRGKRNSSDEFIFGAFDILLLPFWPIVLPYILVSWLRKGRGVVLQTQYHGEHDDLIGLRAIAMSDLRPSGRIKIGSEVYDALSECGIISVGEAVEVVGRDSLRVLVKNVAEQGAGADR